MNDEDDDILFAAEDDDEVVKEATSKKVDVADSSTPVKTPIKKSSKNVELSSKWRVLIVDDEEQIHSATKLVLGDYKFCSKEIEFIHAYTGAEARKIMGENQDVALILLDVVMETEHAGLETVEFIRNELGNDNVRIILRTGQPGQAPREEVIIKYDINDYKEKTELTSEKLFTSVTTALRSFTELMLKKKAQEELEILNRDLEEKVEERTANLKKEMLEKQNLQGQLIESEKLAAVGSLATGVAHEFNNINTSIMGYTSLVLRQKDLPEKVLNWLEHIKSSIIKSSNISKNLMVYTSRDDLMIKKVNIITFLKDAIEFFSSNYNDVTVKFKQECKDDLLIMLDVIKMGHVMHNLLENAAHSLVDREIKELKLTVTKGSSHIQIVVEDAGCGIKDEELKDVFLPFYTKKGEKCLDGGILSKVKGVGLGLSVCQSVIKRLNGTIEVFSKENAGTKVEIILPL